jgi:hypothetical protein
MGGEIISGLYNLWYRWKRIAGKIDEKDHSPE